jgi:uncharacterized protein
MPFIDSTAPGSFCWVELATLDQDGAKQFYTSLFGWTYVDSPMGPGQIYTMFKQMGGDVGAAFTLNEAMLEQGVPPCWTLYVATESVDDTVQDSLDAGGRTVNGPFDVSTYGRMAVLQDPTGAVFAIWEPKSHKGIGITGEEGCVCWADLSTPDPDAASNFYNAAFGWNFELGQDGAYLHIKNGDAYIGGIPSAEQRMPGAPPHWMTYFQVANCDNSVAKAKELGARIYVEPMPVQNVGRMAVLADPQGAVFAIFEPAPRQ